jgi:hypothetical protein
MEEVQAAMAVVVVQAAMEAAPLVPAEGVAEVALAPASSAGSLATGPQAGG